MKNPFLYGQAVTGENFADRREDLSMLIRDLMDCEWVFLISLRRYGKTSLIDVAITEQGIEHSGSVSLTV